MSACAALWRGAKAPQHFFPLIVNNQSDFEVIVYAIPSQGSGGIRIGNARPFATTTMSVSRNALQPSDILVVNIRSVGAARSVRSWTSPGVSLDSTLVAELYVRADASGNLRRSSLFTEEASAVRPPGGRRQ